MLTIQSSDLAIVGSGNKFICTKTQLWSVVTVDTTAGVIKVIEILRRHCTHINVRL